MITTLGQFLVSLPRDTFFVADREEDGSRSYWPIEDIPGDCHSMQQEVVVVWTSEDCALVCKAYRADPQLKMFVNKRAVFVEPVRVVHYPVADPEKIIAHACQQARLDEAWKIDYCTNIAQLAQYAEEFAIYFELKDEQHTDDAPRYLAIYKRAYAQAYCVAVAERMRRRLDDIYGKQEGQF